MNLKSWSASHVGLVRKNNEDAVGCFPEWCLFIVADGMGGRTAGEVASQMAVDAVHDFLRNHMAESPGASGGDGFSTEAVETLLRSAVELANERIFESGRHASSGSMGSTVLVVHLGLEARRAHWAYVGDSRLYLARNGSLQLLTADHTLFGEPFRDGGAVPLDLPHTNRLTRALGVAPTVEVSTGSGDILPGDVFLLCSDGISGMLEPPVLLRDLIENGALDAAGNALIRHALEAGGRDNASAVLARVCGS